MGRSEGVLMSKHGHLLVMPDELRRLDEREQLLLVRRHWPVQCQKRRFYSDAKFDGLAAGPDEQQASPEGAI